MIDMIGAPPSGIKITIDYRLKKPKKYFMLYAHFDGKKSCLGSGWGLSISITFWNQNHGSFLAKKVKNKRYFRRILMEKRYQLSGGGGGGGAVVFYPRGPPPPSRFLKTFFLQNDPRNNQFFAPNFKQNHRNSPVPFCSLFFTK